MAHTNTAGEVSRLLDDLVGRVEAVDRALVLSRDGLIVAATAGFGREDSEHLSALVAGVQGLARGACRHFEGGEVLQTVIEMDSVLLFMGPAGEDTYLAVLGSPDADAGIIAYEMTTVAERLCPLLPPDPRLAAEASGVR